MSRGTRDLDWDFTGMIKGIWEDWIGFFIDGFGLDLLDCYVLNNPVNPIQIHQ